MERNLIRFFKTHSKGRGRRRWGCLDESELAAYADHLVAGSEKDRIEAHLADCDFCLRQVAFLARMTQAQVPESVPDSLLSRAQESARQRSRPGFAWAWRWEAVAAGVAGLAVVAVLSFWNPVRETPTVQPPAAVTPTTQAPSPVTPEASSQPAPAPTVRGATPQTSVPTLIFPRPNTTLSGGPIEFRWEGVRNAVYYELRLVTVDGDLVWEYRTERNSASLPADVKLQAGQKYFIWIEAFLAEGKTAESAAVAFTVAGRDQGFLSFQEISRCAAPKEPGPDAPLPSCWAWR